MNSEDKKIYLKFAKDLALEAGAVMRKYFLHTEREWKEDQTPLTIVDTTINQLVIDRIAERFPEHSVLGEEQSAMKDSRYTWVCDPVDGTMPYSHGLPISTFSLALCNDGVSIVGVVYDPFMERMFWATKDGGAYCNDNKLAVRNGGLENALVDIAGFPSTVPVVDVDSRLMNAIFAEGAKVTSLWSAILPSCLVAAGDYTAVILNVPFPQDPAAIKVIVEEAGGKVTDLYGNDQRYDQPTKGFIASNGVVHDELIKIITEESNEV